MTSLIAIAAHPHFERLCTLETERSRLVRRPGGRDLLAANSAACMTAENAIMRATGCTMNEITSAIAMRANGRI